MNKVRNWKLPYIISIEKQIPTKCCYYTIAVKMGHITDNYFFNPSNSPNIDNRGEKKKNIKKKIIDKENNNEESSLKKLLIEGLPTQMDNPDRIYKKGFKLIININNVDLKLWHARLGHYYNQNILKIFRKPLKSLHHH
ncbi:hypothetical protein H8356DRAFT_1363524 [Neocallimastix lanati (nom. inval.)]|nr:hypothetical protein H8356DRAFT_1363524 [Neocallimastix sp. JGI-2020a]